MLRWLVSGALRLRVAVVALMVVFFQDLFHEFPLLWSGDHGMSGDGAIMLALTLTSVANVLVTMALAPLASALLARAGIQHAGDPDCAQAIMFREPPQLCDAFRRRIRLQNKINTHRPPL